MQEATTGCQEVPEAKMEAQAAGGGHRVQSRAARLPSGCGRDGPESRANPKSARPAPRATRPPARNLFLTEGEPAPPLGGHVAAPCSALGAVARGPGSSPFWPLLRQQGHCAGSGPGWRSRGLLGHSLPPAHAGQPCKTPGGSRPGTPVQLAPDLVSLSEGGPRQALEEAEPRPGSAGRHHCPRCWGPLTTLRPLLMTRPPVRLC